MLPNLPLAKISIRSCKNLSKRHGQGPIATRPVLARNQRIMKRISVDTLQTLSPIQAKHLPKPLVQVNILSIRQLDIVAQHDVSPSTDRFTIDRLAS